MQPPDSHCDGVIGRCASAERYAALVQLEQASREERDRRSFFDAAVSLIGRTLEADLVDIAEMDGDSLIIRACVGYEDGVRDSARVSSKRTPYGLAVTSGDTVVVEELARDSRFDGPRFLEDRGVRSVLAANIPNGGSLRGCLCAHACRSRVFSDEERDFLSAAAGIVGLWLASRDPAMQSPAREQADFLAVVAHDLRNPLAAVDAAMEVLAGARNGEDALVRLARVVPLVRRNVTQMTSLITDLLDLDSLQRGGPILHLDEPRVLDILREVYDLMRELAAQRGVSLSVSVPPGDWRVTCDRHRIVEVFSNLIGNALKFTPKGGLIEVDVHCDNDATEFTVRDSGVGIPESELGRVFDRRYHGKSNGGTGLGLAIVRAIVEAHGGSIGVHSAEGQGSVFSFTLPRNVRESGRFTLQTCEDSGPGPNGSVAHHR
ncbi:MAG: ATP-binding protein [Polyangiales bacterium]